MGRLTVMMLLGAAWILALANSPARAQVLLDETNIVGLPLYETMSLLAGEGYPIHFGWLNTL